MCTVMPSKPGGVVSAVQVGTTCVLEGCSIAQSQRDSISDSSCGLQMIFAELVSAFMDLVLGS
jgi:hypothetical protein